MLRFGSAPWGVPGRHDLPNLAITALAGLLCVAALPAAQAADQVTSYTVLSPDDVKTYGAIFAAQKTGQFAKADSLTAKLGDKSLVGYVLEDRYLGPNYRSKFAELKAWLEDYGDLAGADQIAIFQHIADKGFVPELGCEAIGL